MAPARTAERLVALRRRGPFAHCDDQKRLVRPGRAGRLPGARRESLRSCILAPAALLLLGWEYHALTGRRVSMPRGQHETKGPTSSRGGRSFIAVSCNRCLRQPGAAFAATVPSRVTVEPRGGRKSTARPLGPAIPRIEIAAAPLAVEHAGSAWPQSLQMTIDQHSFIVCDLSREQPGTFFVPAPPTRVPITVYRI